MQFGGGECDASAKHVLPIYPAYLINCHLHLIILVPATKAYGMLYIIRPMQFINLRGIVRMLSFLMKMFFHN